MKTKKVTKKSSKKILLFGCFDLIHKGHLNLFEQANKHGQIIVVIARDKTIKKIKTKPPKHKEKQRLKHLKKIKTISKVYLGNTGNKYKIIKKINPDIICLGYDQKIYVKDLKKELNKRKLKIKVIRLKPYKPHKYKSSKLKKTL